MTYGRNTALSLLTGAVLCARLSACAGATTEIAPTETADSGTAATSLNVGTCILDDVSGSAVTRVVTVPCTEPHDTEIFASILMADGVFPGTDAVATTATEKCGAQFAVFIGIPFANSTLSYQYFAPSAQTWSAGDREILCLVRDPAGPMTGTLANSAR